MAEPLAVTVYSDVICPWCYVGKRRFEAALGGPGVPAEVTFHWLPFELNPDMPDEGITRAEYRTRKFGADALRTAEAHLGLGECLRAIGRAAEARSSVLAARTIVEPQRRTQAVLMAEIEGELRARD